MVEIDLLLECVSTKVAAGIKLTQITIFLWSVEKNSGANSCLQGTNLCTVVDNNVGGPTATSSM